MMSMRTIRDRLHKEPFEPFGLRLTDGRSSPIVHPDFVALGRSVVVITDDEDGVREVDALHVVSLDPMGKAKKRSGKH
jgi:hypothetical protein